MLKRQGKPRPDFTGTDSYQVTLTLRGQVQDTRFISFLEQVDHEVQVSFDVQDLLLLDLIHREEPISVLLQPRIRRLADLGVIETIGRGRGTRYLLARRFYVTSGQRGLYTRRRGLDRDQNKALLLKHLQEAFPDGCAISELQQVVPALSRAHIKRLLDELRRGDSVRVEGQKRGAKWHAIELPKGECH